MALLFFDNFGGYATADILKVWAVNTGSYNTVVSSGGRNNGSYTTANHDTSKLFSQPFTSSSTVVVGFAFNTSTLACTTSAGIVSLYDSGVVQMTLSYMNSTGLLQVFRGSNTAVTGGLSLLGLLSNTWYYIEMKVTVADSIGAGTCEVRVNGATWITVATGQDLQATANATANQIVLGRALIGSSNATHLYSDIYIDNGTTFLGDCTVSTLTVSGAGTTNTLTTGTFADVDDATPDSDSTYAESAVNGQLATFAISNLVGTPVTIHAVSPWSLIRKTDGGTKTARTVIRSGGTDYGQTDFNATDSYLYNAPITTVDPATGVAWVAAGVNAIEVGFEVRS